MTKLSKLKEKGKAMADMEKLMTKAVEILERKDYNIIQIIDDAVICEDEDCIVICRVRYTTGEYLKDPTREECEKIMTSVLMDANFDKTGPIRFDEIQVLDFENGHGLLRHHINVAND